MTTKHPSRLATSGPADESEQITKEHNDDDDESHIVSIDPSEDVTVEATEDVTTEAPHTPEPSMIPGTVGVSPGQRAPTLLGVPIQSLPLPGVTSAQAGETRTIDYNDEITVLAQPAPADPLAALDEALDERPSITDDDEEETKVEPAEAAMKAAESIDDVTTALSAQANLEREKALRRSAPAPAPSDDLEFADPDADDEESLDDEIDDDDEVISAGGAIEEEEDDDDVDTGAGDGVATATFMKPADTTGLSGLLNPRRPPTGGRDGFGSRLPTPYPPPQTTIPAPSTSPFASRLGPAPSGAPYGGRSNTGAMTAIQVPPPSGKATTESEPGFFVRQVKMPSWMLIVLVGGALIAGFGAGGLRGSRSAAPTVIVAKPTTPVTPAAPVVEPVQTGTTAVNPAGKPADTPTVTPTGPEVTGVQAIGTPTENANPDNPETGLWRPTKKPAAQRPHKAAADGAEDAMLKPKPAVAKEPKPVVAKEPKEPKEPKPAAAAKPAGKKSAKAWVDPFAN